MAFSKLKKLMRFKKSDSRIFSISIVAKALEPSVIIFVSTKEFEKKLEGSDMIVRGVMAILSERLRDLQKRR